MRVTDGEPEQSGMGLGLWIAQNIVERHGGRMVLQRREPCGTRVAITLLLERVHEDSGRG
jgi:signal transduction histidine kinase